MAKETGVNKKIIAIIVAVVLVIAAAVTTVIIINNNNKNNDNGDNNTSENTSENNNEGSNEETLSDDFFETTDDKIVISTASNNAADSSVALKVHQVYTVDGDTITGLKVYSEFDSEESAKAADAKPEVEEGMQTGKYVDHKVEGKYLIVTMPESMYQSVTATDIRATAAAMEQASQAQSAETEE
ncbi:hypothetical protein IJJ18_02715 [Candidatus Saccharibacteria bacterium]|nr:hypothetical protein [Candidatus Saccharibacteria bacterium]